MSFRVIFAALPSALGPDVSGRDRKLMAALKDSSGGSWERQALLIR